MRLLVATLRRGARRASATCARHRRAGLLTLALAAMAGGAAPAAASTDGEDWAIALIRRTSAADAAGTRHPLRRHERARQGVRLSRPALARGWEGIGRRAVPRALSEQGRARRSGRLRHARGTAPTPQAKAPALPQGVAQGVAQVIQGAMPGAALAAPLPGSETGRRRAAERPGTMLASLGREFMRWVPNPPPSLSGAPIRWVASADCLAGALRSVLVELAASFGPLVVNSTCRSRRHNAQVGGARRSFHLTGNAVDFRVAGNPRPVLAFLRARKDVGGLKHYGGGVFHLDTGPRRTW